MVQRLRRDYQIKTRYDRLRENFTVKRKGTPTELCNLSVNQMLGRTLMTSITTMLVLIALVIAGMLLAFYLPMFQAMATVQGG